MLDINKKHLNEVKKKLNNAQEEIKDLKGCKTSQEKLNPFMNVDCVVFLASLKGC